MPAVAHVAWFRAGCGRWEAHLSSHDELRLTDAAKALGERNGMEWVVLPKGVRPDGNAPLAGDRGGGSEWRPTAPRTNS